MIAALPGESAASLNASNFVSRDESDRNGLPKADDAAFEAARRGLALGPMTLGLPSPTPVHLRLPRRNGSNVVSTTPNREGGGDANEREAGGVAPASDTRQSWPGATPTPETRVTDASRKMLRLSLFGPVTLRFGDHEIRVRSLKLRAMLGYIALSESRRETRERLVGLLWSESGEAQARAVLRQVIRELRGLFTNAGFDGLRIGAHEIGFDPEQVEVDVWAVIRAAEAEEAHPLLLGQPRLGDELLAGLEDLDPAFRGWVLAKRETLRDRLMRLLETALADDRLDPRKESTLAEAILNLDPTHEDACRRLMRARAVAGDTAGALRAYKALWDLLDEDYGMEPAPLTQQLVAEIKNGAFEHAVSEPPARGLSARETARSWPPARGTPDLLAPPLARQETKLKLSLRDVIIHAVDADKAHLVHGFRQHMIASLVRFREWQVTDAPFAETAASGTPGASGRYELQMTAHQTGQAVNLLLVLKELETNQFIWSDGFELKLESWFDSQRRVVRRVAIALNVYLSAERLQRLSEQPEVSLGIYDRWLRCQTQIRTFGPQYWDRSAQQFAEIIDAAPNFVPAYCGLADLQSGGHVSHPGMFRTREGERKALALGQKAVHLDPSDSNAHRCLAWAHAMAKQYPQAEMHIELACELNQNDSWTLISAAQLLVFCGQPERGLPLLEPALDLAVAPSRSHWAYHCFIQFLTGHYETALASAERAQDVLAGTMAAWQAAAFAHLGRQDEAAAAAERFLAESRAGWFGAEPATDEAIMRWLLHLYPIARRGDWARLRDGLRLAGLPTSGAEHHGW
jgi:DNA-binding SARP family transcriptional activator/tetratricopeptide (TPR) repeat protein